jgi:predicted ATPase
MIRSFKVERFKSLDALELELGRINVFIGANGSGKSNLLEAVGVLGAAAFGRVDDETLLRRGVRPGVPMLYKTAFPTKEKKPNLFFRAVSDLGARYEVGLWNPLEDPGPAWRFMTERLERSTGDVVVTRGTKFGIRNQEQGMAALETVNLKPGDPALGIMDELRAYGIYCPNTPALRGLVQDLQTREPIGLAGGRLPEAVDELLSLSRRNGGRLTTLVHEVLELLDWASDFSAGPSLGVPLSPSAARSRLVIQFTDRYMRPKRNKLTAYDASEGALYILCCAVLALHPKAPRCLAVDNVDQALNPRLAMKLMSALCSWTGQSKPDQQWLLTAHNPAVLDGMPLSEPDVRLFSVDRDNRGHTIVQRIDLDAAMKKRPNTEWTLSRMWMAGFLGAVPNV